MEKLWKNEHLERQETSKPCWKRAWQLKGRLQRKYQAAKARAEHNLYGAPFFVGIYVEVARKCEARQNAVTNVNSMWHDLR